MDHVMERIHAALNHLISQHCTELTRIWQRMGMEEQFLLESRLPLITGWLSDLLEDMVRGEINLESSLIESVQSKLATVRQMEAELRAELAGAPGASVAQELAPMPDLPESCGLIQRENRLSQRIAELQTLRLRFAAQGALAQMRTLWRRLQIDRPDAERQYWESLAASRHVTPDCLQRMERELARLRQQVLPRLKECVADCRREIGELADRCLAAPDELEALRPLLESQNWSEELLDRHEAEAARLRERLARHGEFYASLADWQSGWNSLQALLQRLKDPAVLNNRGGVLLRLERERKRAQAAVSAKEAELFRMDAEAASTVRVCGLALADFLAGVKQRAEAEKENEAKRRVEKHETTLRRELQFGSKPASPMQRRVIHNSSRIVVPCKAPPQVTKNLGESKLGCSGRIEKRRSGKTSALVTAQKLLRRSVKKLQQDGCGVGGNSILLDLPEGPKLYQHQRQHQQHPADTSVSTSYSAFQSGVGFRSSTVFPNSSAAAIAAAAAVAAAAAAAAAAHSGVIPSVAGTATIIGAGGGGGGGRHCTAGSQCDSGLSSLANH